jgi:hypothetical protein
MPGKAKLLTATALTLVTALPAFAAGLDARLNATRVAEGDQVVLSLSMDASGDAAFPDLSVLAEDFAILGTSSGTQTSIINGARSDLRTWSITLQPKHDGTLTIPAISAGTLSSEPITLNVVDAAQLPPEAQAARPGITASLGTAAIYAHQEVPLTVTVRLPAGTQGAAITTPETSAILIEQSGEDRIARQPDGAARLERTYLLRPQSEGEMILDGFTVTIDVADASAPDPFANFGRSPFAGGAFDRFFGGNSPFGRSPFAGMMSPTKRLSATSDPIVMNVAPTPGGASGWALPAKGVELRQIWQPDPPAFRVGEAVTRKIQVIALGAHAEQIPDIELPEIPGARVYFEGSDKRTVPTEKGTAAIREFTWSIVPTSGGDLTLPEVAVDWFDTGTEEAARAVLPAEMIHVEGPVTLGPSPDNSATSPVNTANPAALPARWLDTALIAGAALVLTLIGLLGRLLVRSRRSAPARTEPKPAPLAITARQLRQAAIARAAQAARSGDRPALHRAALDWTRAARLSPEEIALKFPGLSDALAALESELYGSGPRARETDLLTALKAADAALAESGRGRTILPPLYPEVPA